MKFLAWYSAILVSLSVVLSLMTAISESNGLWALDMVLNIPVAIYLWLLIARSKQRGIKVAKS